MAPQVLSEVGEAPFTKEFLLSVAEKPIDEVVAALATKSSKYKYILEETVASGDADMTTDFAAVWGPKDGALVLGMGTNPSDGSASVRTVYFIYVG
ncbi:hypothetical protein DICA3_C00298 [Diutina catenulata]